MRRIVRALLFSAVASCARDVPRTPAVAHAGADCFGGDSLVSVDANHIGALSLDHATVGSLERACPNFAWTTTNGDEELDTALVVERPGLRVIANIATIGDEDGFHKVQIDSSMPVREWTVSGAAGRLGDVPLTATWTQVSRVYGPLRASALNGTVYATSCRLDVMLLMATPSPNAPINPVDGQQQRQELLDSVMANQRIESVALRPGGFTAFCKPSPPS